VTTQERNFLNAEEEIKSARAVSIYGAGIIAFNIALALKSLYRISVLHFYVSSQEQGTSYFGGMRASVFSEADVQKDKLLLVAVPVEYHRAIETVLKKAGHDHYILIDNVLEYELMGRYFEKEYHFRLLEKEKPGQGADKKTVEVYMAKSIYDKILTQNCCYPEFVIPVQAGAALTSEKIEKLGDNTGCNLSIKNKYYSEMTVTYWAWKNRQADYMGICHYRRWLDIQDELEQIETGNVDIILPLPFVCSQRASEQFMRYISEEEYQIFCRILKQTYPERMEEMLAVLEGKLIYNYNMFLARREIFAEYCNFIFTVLEQVDGYYEKHNLEKRPRFLGYLAEILTSTFFLLHQNRWRIVHAGKCWVA